MSTQTVETPAATKTFARSAADGAVWPLLLTVLIFCAAAFMHRHNDGLWFQGDSPRHFMNGVFWGEFATSGQYLEAKSFALDFYQKYPAIAPTIWPPFVYFIEAGVFFVTGPSIVAARLIVLGLALLGAVYMVLLLQRWAPDTPAPWLALPLIAQPMLQQWTHAVMMDVPAVALGIASVYYLDRACSSENRRDLILALAFILAGTLTRLTTIVFPASYVLALWVTGGGRRLLRLDAILLAGVMSLGIAAWLVVNFKYGAIMAKEATHLGGVSRLSWENWLYYPREVAAGVQPWFFPAAAIGAVLGCTHAAYRKLTVRLLLATLIVFFVFSMISLKDDRYVMMILPWLTGLQGAGVAALYVRMPAVPLRRVAIAGLAVFAAVWGVVRAPIPRIDGFRDAVVDLAQRVGAQRILYDGRFDGVFTAYCLTASPEGRELTVSRGAKVFYATALQKGFGLVERARTPEDIAELVSRNGTRWLVIERQELAGIEAAKLLRRVVASDERFRHVHTYPIDSRDVEQGELDALDLYEYTGPIAAESSVELLFPVLEH